MKNAFEKQTKSQITGSKVTSGLESKPGLTGEVTFEWHLIDSEQEP
jgi:hypothetical protein